jgi:hypothetical protein
MQKILIQNVRLLSDEPISENKLQQQFVITDSILTKEILNGIDYCLKIAYKNKKALDFQGLPCS